jgi:hypothetical protein
MQIEKACADGLLNTVTIPNYIHPFQLGLFGMRSPIHDIYCALEESGCLHQELNREPLDRKKDKEGYSRSFHRV